MTTAERFVVASCLVAVGMTIYAAEVGGYGYASDVAGLSAGLLLVVTGLVGLWEWVE